MRPQTHHRAKYIYLPYSLCHAGGMSKHTKPEQASAATGEHTIHPPSADKTLQWITVLSAVGLDYRLSRDHGIWHLHVPEDQAASATTEIEAFENDAGMTHPEQAPRHSKKTIRTAHWTAFWCAYAIVLAYLWFGPFNATSELHAAGAMSRTELSGGEWWRSITALTLHSGPVHLAANILFILFVGQAVVRELGRGLGPAMMLAGGVLGNILAAGTASPYQRSIGASTACFAALGIMSTLQAAHLYRRFRDWQQVWHQAWIPLAAGTALLGLTGTSQGSDLAAHLFGFVAGAILAIPAAIAQPAVNQISTAMQWSLVALTAMLPLLAWTLAAIHLQTPF
jgi:rhomboid protease GluP